MNTPEFRKHAIRLVLLVLAIALGWQGLRFLRNYRFAEQLAKLSVAIEQDAVKESIFLLQILSAQRPKDPELLVARARLFSRLNLPDAPAAWEAVILARPENPEYRVAQILSLLQQKNLAQAELSLERWPESLRSQASWHRASLAVAFAKPDYTKALSHAREIYRLEPNSESAQLNLAKLGLRSKETDTLESARQSLILLSDRPTTRTEAMKCLAQDALSRGDRAEAIRLAERAWAAGSPMDSLISLEIRTEANDPIDEETLRKAWLQVRSDPPALARLCGWMAVSRHAAAAIRFLSTDPPLDPWDYPTGVALSECAIAAGNPLVARSGLSKVKWGGLDYLRLFCFARVSEEAQQPEIMNRAIQEATLRRGGLRHLIEVTELWRWEAGMVRLLQERLRDPSCSLREMNLLFALLEQRRDAKAMLEAMLQIFARAPENPMVLNNVAYFTLLTEGDAQGALKWSKKAVALQPGNKEMQATLALAHLRVGESEAALQLARECESARVEGLALRALRLPIPEALATRIQAEEAIYPEEKALSQLALKPFDNP